MLDGKMFRFSGANIEWLGLIGYGPLNVEPDGQQVFPSHFEVHDVLATAKETGATVTLGLRGDGQPLCLEGGWRAGQSPFASDGAVRGHTCTHASTLHPSHQPISRLLEDPA